MRTRNNQDASISSWTVPSTLDTEHGLQDDEDADMLLVTVTPRHDSIGLRTNKATTQVCINIKAADVEEEQRAAVDFVVALDVSGSMLGDNIKKCKQTLEFMVRALTSSDRFGLITYSSNAKVALPAMKMTPENKEVALQKINTIHADGQTNLSGGLALALQEIRFIKEPNIIQTVFLLTDGHANVGVTRTEALCSMVRECSSTRAPNPTLPVQAGIKDLYIDGVMAKDDASVDTKPSTIQVETGGSPISLVCFGYGGDHNSRMLSAIAKETPGGAYYFIDHKEESNVAVAFGEAMGGILSVVAQSAVLTISLPPFAAEKGINIVNIHHEEAISRGEGIYSVNINDFYAEESRDVMFEVQLTNVVHSIPCPHAMVSVTYFDAIHGNSCTRGPFTCNIARPDNEEMSPINAHVDEQWTRIETVQEINAALREADANEFQAARERLQGAARKIRAKIHLSSEYINELVNDVEEATRGLACRSTYFQSGRHTMTNMSLSFGMQRGMASTLQADALMQPGTSHPRYSTKKRTMLAEEFAKQSKEQKYG
jgi:Ca-activated chloride channel homolog